MEIGKIVLAFIVAIILVGATAGICTHNTQVKVDSAVSKVTTEKDGVISTLKLDKEKLSNQVKVMESSVKSLGDDLNKYKGDVESLTNQVNELKTKPVIPTDTKPVETKTNAYTSDEYAAKVSLSKTLTSRQLTKLGDYEVKFSGDKYSVKSLLEINGIEFNVGGDEYKDNLYLEIYPNSIVYKVILDSDIDYTKITKDKPLKINFLGAEYKISKLTDSEMVVTKGDKYFVSEGESLTIDGKTFVIKAIGESSGDAYVFITSDSENIKLESGESDTLNDVEFYADDILVNDNGVDSVELTIGTDVSQEFESGDSFIEDDDEWIFNIAKDGSSYVLSLSYDQTRNSVDEDEDYPAIALGQTISLPNNFLTLSFDSTNEPKYNKYDFSFANVDVTEDSVDEPIVKVKGTLDKGFEFGTEVTNIVYLYNNKIYYKNEDNKYVEITKEVFFEDSDTKLLFSGITISVEDFSFNMDSVTKNIDYDYCETDDNFMTTYGVKVLSPEDNTDNDKVVISVPDEKLKAVYAIN